MLRDVKSKIWRRWGEIVREEVTTLREIVNPILAYSESLKKTEGRKKGEIFGQGQIEMINAFFKARKVSIETGLRDLRECVAQIPIYLLFWLPRPPSIRTFLRRSGSNGIEQMIANAYAYRTIIPDRHIILGDGVVIEARKDDPDSYLVMTGDGKRKDGYLAVIITLSDGFPLIGDLVNIRGRNDFKTVNEESNRRLRKYELLANFLVSDRKDRKNIVKVSRDRIRKETEMSLFTKLAELLINNGVLRHGDIFSGDSVYGHKTVRELLAKTRHHLH